MTALAGQVAVVTGANSGVGFEASKLLAAAGAEVVMVCRSRERGSAALEAVRAAAFGGAAIRGRSTARDANVAREGDGSAPRLEIADLSHLDDVRGLAARLVDAYAGIDILVNNAGVWRARREQSPQGHELTMATNHLGHFVLTGLLLERLRGGRGRIVNVSSEAHRRGDLRRTGLRSIFSGAAWSNGIQAYSDSKLANVLFTTELVRRHGAAGIAANALHPGVLSTRIWNQNASPASLVMRLAKPFMQGPKVGGRAVLGLAADPDLQGVSGRYYKVETEVEVAPQAADADLARELWDLSEELSKLEY